MGWVAGIISASGNLDQLTALKLSMAGLFVGLGLGAGIFVAYWFPARMVDILVSLIENLCIWLADLRRGGQKADRQPDLLGVEKN